LKCLISLHAYSISRRLRVVCSWAVITVMSGRVYLNLGLVTPDRGRNGMTARFVVIPYRMGQPSRRHRRGGGHIETFGVKQIHSRIPTFSTVSLYFLFLFSSLYSLHRLRYTLFPDGLQRGMQYTAGSRTGLFEVNRGEDAVIDNGTLMRDGVGGYLYRFSHEEGYLLPHRTTDTADGDNIVFTDRFCNVLAKVHAFYWMRSTTRLDAIASIMHNVTVRFKSSHEVGGNMLRP
jgi:hypothetical protein